MDQTTISIIFFFACVLIAGIVVYFILKKSRRAKERYLSQREEDASGGDGGSPRVPEEKKPSRDSLSPLPGLRQRLANSAGIGKTLVSLLSRDKLAAEDWDDVEEILLGADVGMNATEEIVRRLRHKMKDGPYRNAGELQELLVAELTSIVDSGKSRRSLDLGGRSSGPAVIMMVGVNGAGKTTAAAKIARLLVSQGRKVVLGAADTFRAAAAEQLATWGSRIGVPTVTSDVEGSDPAAVAYQAVKAGTDACSDVVIVDTAGRLQNKVGLMDELAKIRRVIEKQTRLNEVLLVIDATTGQNGLNQAKIFKEAVDVTGIVLTKLDGTAKGGIVVAIQQELGVPVKLIGLGEGPEDLLEFKPEEFAEALVAG